MPSEREQEIREREPQEWEHDQLAERLRTAVALNYTSGPLTADALEAADRLDRLAAYKELERAAREVAKIKWWPDDEPPDEFASLRTALARLDREDGDG